MAASPQQRRGSSVQMVRRRGPWPPPGQPNRPWWRRWFSPLWWRRWLSARLGYRGLVLTLFGLIYCGVGYSIPGSNDYRVELLHTHFPLSVRILLWAIPGLGACLVAWEGKLQGWGFAGLFVSPAVRGVSYAVALIENPGLVTDRDDWSPLPGLLVNTLLVITMLIMAGWPEPPDGERVEHEVGRALDQLGASVDDMATERRSLTEMSGGDAGEDGERRQE